MAAYIMANNDLTRRTTNTVLTILIATMVSIRTTTIMMVRTRARVTTKMTK